MKPVCYCKPWVLPQPGNGVCRDIECGVVLDLTYSLGKVSRPYQLCLGGLPSAWLVLSVWSECASPGPVVLA